MQIDDLMALLDKNPDCNFIAMAMTTYQAIGVTAAIRYLTEKGIELNGYILMTSHPNTGRVLNESFFPNIPKKIHCVNFEYSFKRHNGPIQNIKIRSSMLFLTLRKVKFPSLYFVWTEVVNNILYAIWKTNKARNLSFFKIDDGAASYIDPYKCRLSYLLYATKGNKIKRALSYVKAAIYGFFTNIMEKKLKKCGSFINGNIFVKEKINNDYRLSRNGEITKFYIQAFGEVKSDLEDSRKIEDTVLINSQGLEEFGISRGEDYYAFEKIATILDSLDFKVVLKPHPREREIEKYAILKWRILTSPIAQEVLIAKAKSPPKCIISIYSSTLLNSYGLFGITVISLARILLNEQLSDTFRKELERYIQMYKGIVLFPASYDEFESIMKRYKNGRN